MVYTEHTPVKPEKIIATGAAVLEQNLVIPALFARQGADAFKGAKDDTINYTVDGVLPYRKYGWRNNRATSLQFDTYTERKVPITFGDDLYNGVALTDEQANFDFAGWEKLVTKQVEAIGRGLEYEAVDAFDATPFEVVVQLDQADLRGSLVKLRSVFNKLMVPGQRTLLCNADLEAALLNDDDLNLAQNVGDALADRAVTEAIIGRRLGFSIASANEMGAYSVASVPSAYVLYTAAPAVPASAGFGATASANGVALRWVRGFDINTNVEKSVVSAYHTFRYIKDPLVARISADDPSQAVLSTTEHFVRAVKVTVGSGYSVELANQELEDFTGIESTDGTSDGS